MRAAPWRGEPRNVELVLLCASAPPPLAERQARVCVVTASAFVSSREEAVAALRSVASCPVEGARARDLNVSTPFAALFRVMDAAFPAGKRYAADTLWLEGEPGALLGAAAEKYELAPSPRSLLLCILPPAPAADVTPLPDCAFSMVGPMYLGCYAIWDDETDDARNAAWLRKTTDALADATIGYYVGDTDLADESRSRRSFSPTSGQRLQELRRKHDPAGVFHDLENGLEDSILAGGESGHHRPVRAPDDRSRRLR